MGYDYALVHAKFTVPLATILTIINYPFVTRRHWYQTAILVTIAVVATIPWDSYLIRQSIWTYPPDAILGPTFWSIPAEELFFFVVQTYITCQLYGLLNKPLLHAEYLASPSWISNGLHRLLQVLILDLALIGFWLVSNGGPGTYMGLILIWACPFALLTWSLGGVFMLSLPLTSIACPIVVSTLYLWVVDEGALQRGTWAIESGTKLGVKLVGNLDIEEAVFFLATNCLIVFGMGAFDNALAIIDVFADIFETAPECPSPTMLIKALLVPWTEERRARIHGTREAVRRLCKKSRSFYLASSAFTGRLRIDLILLYSYCRMADDLVDEPPDGLDASLWIAKLQKHLDLVYKPEKDISSALQANKVRAYIEEEFPPLARSALALLPTTLLPPEPLYKLLEGFRTDATFRPSDPAVREFPIKDEGRLEKYGSQVAGTVGQLCLALISHHSTKPIDPDRGKEISTAAGRMGIALQYVNIARDIAVDTTMGRVYLPTTWLDEDNLTPELVVDTIASGPASLAASANEERDEILLKLVALRRKLLRKAFAIYTEARPTMDGLPVESRRPMIVAVESYMEIGRVLLEQKDTAVGLTESGRPRRATVPKLRRLRVALKAMLYV